MNEGADRIVTTGSVLIVVASALLGSSAMSLGQFIVAMFDLVAHDGNSTKAARLEGGLLVVGFGFIVLLLLGAGKAMKTGTAEAYQTLLASLVTGLIGLTLSVIDKTAAESGMPSPETALGLLFIICGSAVLLPPFIAMPWTLDGLHRAAGVLKRACLAIAIAFVLGLLIQAAYAAIAWNCTGSCARAWKEGLLVIGHNRFFISAPSGGAFIAGLAVIACDPFLRTDEWPQFSRFRRIAWMATFLSIATILSVLYAVGHYYPEHGGTADWMRSVAGAELTRGDAIAILLLLHLPAFVAAILAVTSLSTAERRLPVGPRDAGRAAIALALGAAGAWLVVRHLAPLGVLAGKATLFIAAHAATALAVTVSAVMVHRSAAWRQSPPGPAAADTKPTDEAQMTRTQTDGTPPQDGPVPGNMIERLLRLEHAVERLAETEKRSWFKDRRFWAGAATLPVLLAGGWVFDSVVSRGTLSAIHVLLGTPRALQDKLESDKEYRQQISASLAQEVSLGKNSMIEAIVALIGQDSYRKTLVDTLANEFKDGKSDLPVALKASLMNDFLPLKGFESKVDSEIGKRTPFVHADILNFGLRDLGAVEVGNWDESVPGCKYVSFKEGSLLATEPGVDLIPISEKCPLRYPEDSISLGNTYFVAKADQNVDIGIAIQASDVNPVLLANGRHSDPGLFRTLDQAEIMRRVSIKLEGKELKNFIYQAPIDSPIVSDVAQPPFWYFESTKNELKSNLGPNAFPVRSLALELTQDSEPISATVILIVSRSGRNAN